MPDGWNITIAPSPLAVVVTVLATTMTDWKSIPALIQSALALYKANYVFLGLYTWELLTSLRLEMELVTGKRKFKWPMVFYFICRYLPCVFVAALASQAEAVLRPVNCGAIYSLMYFSSMCAAAFASINFSLRTLAIWNDNRYVRMTVIAVFLGHLVFIGAISPYSFHSVWITSIGCAPAQQNIIGTILIHIYIFVFDLLFLVLALYKLTGSRNRSIPRRGRGQIAYILFTQGISYFALTSILNLASVVFFILDLNASMAVIIATPSNAIIPLLACRMVRGLIFSADADVFVSSAGNKRPPRDLSHISSLRFRGRAALSSAT